MLGLLPLDGYRESTKGGMICLLEHQSRTGGLYLKIVSELESPGGDSVGGGGTQYPSTCFQTGGKSE